MYNQNENAPFVRINAARQRNGETYQPGDEAASQSPDYSQSYMPSGEYEEYSRYGTGTEATQPNMQDPERQPIVNYPMTPHHPNWEPYRSTSGPQYFTAAYQSLYHRPGSGRTAYQPYEAPPQTQQTSQFTTAGDYRTTSYYNSPEYSHQSPSHSTTPAFYPNLDSGEMTSGVAKPPPYIIKACASCKASHVACDPGRPCQRCLRLGKADTCVDAKRKKRGRPKNSSKSQYSQPTTATSDSAGSISAEATPSTTGQSQDPPDQLLELTQLLEEYDSGTEPTMTPSEQISNIPFEDHPGISSGQRKIASVSASTRDGQSSIRKQKSLPGSMAVRRGSSTSPVSTPKRRNSHRSTEDVTVPIQPILLQHHQSVQYPGSQHRQSSPTLPVQDSPSFTRLSNDIQGYRNLRMSAQTQMPSSSTAHARAIHPLSTQLTYPVDDSDTQHQNIPHN